jgi:hypothetical protein
MKTPPLVEIKSPLEVSPEKMILSMARLLRNRHSTVVGCLGLTSCSEKGDRYNAALVRGAAIATVTGGDESRLADCYLIADRE